MTDLLRPGLSELLLYQFLLHLFMTSDTDPDGPATFFIHHFNDQLSDHLLVLKVMWNTDSKCVK